MTTSVRIRAAAAEQSTTSPGVSGWISLLGRLILAGVLGYAALSKIADPAATVRAVRAYRILPDSLAVPFGHALPWVELAVAALLLVGFAARFAGAAAAGLLVMFVGGIASVAARGIRIDCGCFGRGGATTQTHYTAEIVRDLLLLAAAVAVAVIARSTWAADPQPPADLPEPGQGRDAERKHRVAVNRRAAERVNTIRRLQINTAVGGTLVVLLALIGIGAGHSSATTGILVPAGVTADGGIIVGSPSAPHHVIAYEDPQCPVCGDFEKTSGATLATAVAQGKVNVEYRMMSFLGPESVRAVAALGAAAQEGKFDQLREAMFAHQPQERTGGYTIADLLDLGKTVGLTDAAWTSAVQKQTYAPWASSVEQRAEKVPVQATPTVLLDGKAVDQRTVLFNPAAFGKALGLT